MHSGNDSAGSGEQSTGDRPRRRSLGLGNKAPRTRSVMLATGLLVVGIAPFGIAATGDPLREGKRNGTSTRETEVISNIGSSNTTKGGYSTRQSNLSSSGGGAVYGCRSQAGGSRATPTPQNPCVRANNLSRGLAFEFNGTLGDVAGAITVGAGGDTKKPFITNATGVATGLNADRLDNLDASQLLSAAASAATAGTTAATAAAAADATAKANAAKSRFVLIDATGAIEAQSGGFTVRSRYEGDPPGAAGNVYIDAGEDLSNKGIAATIALQNQVDQNADMATSGRVDAADANPEFSGEITATRCAIAGVVVCAPPNTNTNTHFVVSPRLSDGGVTMPATRKRFYVQITG
ncbi:MAG: hypothetical protein WKF96_09310 [Solirubrobacteraceae bacterium]